MPDSKSLLKFRSTSDRAFLMVERHYEIFIAFVENETKEEWDELHDDLFRSAIVMSVTAMDAYFTNRFCEALIPYLKKYKLNKPLINRLESAGFDVEAALEMFNMQRPHRRLSNMVKRNLSNFVTQNFRKVDELYRALGYKEFTVQAEKLARRKTLRSSVQTLVNRRHKIVHQGDYNNHGRLTKVKYSTTIRQMSDLHRLVTTCDQLLAKKGV